MCSLNILSLDPTIFFVRLLRSHMTICKCISFTCLVLVQNMLNYILVPLSVRMLDLIKPVFYRSPDKKVEMD